jgi:AcrR family transcriptional regulator
MRVTKELVIQTAAIIADRDGLSGVSLKVVAAALQIRTPSLYNHIDSLEALLREVAHAGMREMNQAMLQAAVGVTGDAAIHAAGQAYFRFMLSHPGVYEAIQWAGWHRNGETERLYAEYYELLQRLVLSSGLEPTEMMPAIRLLSGFLHGYTTQQLGAAMLDPETAMGELATALDTVLLGLHQMYPHG